MKIIMNNLQIEIYFDKNHLIIKKRDSKITLKFKYDIDNIQKFNDCFVIMLGLQKHVIFNENIYGVSYDGKILWQIEKNNHLDEDSPYTGLGVESNLLTAYNWDGYDYLINPQTGKIIDKKFVK